MAPSMSYYAIVAVSLLAYVASAAPPAKCPPGQGLIPPSMYCQPCPALTYSTGGGTVCKKCPAGTYSDNLAGIGATKCIKCTKKTFIDKNGSTCSDYIVCQPKKLPVIMYCGAGQCFHYKKKCCVHANDSTYKCLKTPNCAPGEC